MPEPKSLTTEKSLVVQLQPLICCSESQLTCMDNEFCSSSPADWPTIENGKTMVKMSYPEGENNETLQGIEGFCDAYIDWNMRTGCAGIAADMVKELSVKPRQPGMFSKSKGGLFALFMSDADKNQCTAQLSDAEGRLARSREIVAEKCGVMFNEKNGQFEFDRRKAGDLKNIADLCLAANSDKESSGTGLWDFIKGGGVVSGIIFALWIFRKLVRISRTGMGAMGDAAYITQGVSEMLRPVTRSLRHLFGVDVPNFLRAAGYIVTFGWLRGKKLPAEIPIPAEPAVDPPIAAAANSETGMPNSTATPAEQPATANEAAATPRPSPPAAHAESDAETPPAAAAMHQPHPDVVLVQLEALAEMESYRREGKNFLALSSAARAYVADLAVTRWNAEPAGTKQIYTDEDTRLTEGKLPRQYLMRFAKQFLRSGSSLSILEASARRWSENGGHRIVEDRGGPVNPADFAPRPVDVKRQMIPISDFAHATPEAQDYVVRMAISEWNMTSRETQADFISDSDTPEMGTLPTKFIRFFRRNSFRSMKEIETRARMFAIIETQVPEMIGRPFYYVDMRIQQIARAWSYLPNPIQHEFRQLASDLKDRRRGSLPFVFAEYMMKAISIGTIARLPTNISSVPWKYEDSTPIPYQDYDVRNVMQNLSTLNKMFPHYPELLRSRATSVIDAWILLPQKIRDEFALIDDSKASQAAPIMGPVEENIPMSFVEFMHKSNTGIGTDGRKGIKGTRGGSSDGEDEFGPGTPPDTGSSDSGAGFNPSSTQPMGSSQFGRAAMTSTPMPPVATQTAHGAMLYSGLPMAAVNSAAMAQATLQMSAAAAFANMQAAGSAAIMAISAGAMR